MESIYIRRLEPSDYFPVISVLNEWWGGRNMRDMLPKLFFVHFRQTSFAACHDGSIAGFLVGFISQTFSNEAYIHFVGVHPQFRGKGLGRTLYARFFEEVEKKGCRMVRCITSPANKNSISFHLRMGFSMEPSEKIREGIPFAEDYDGQGEDRVLFYKALNI